MIHANQLRCRKMKQQTQLVHISRAPAVKRLRIESTAAAAAAAHANIVAQQQPRYSTDAVTADAFEEEEYEQTKQSSSRKAWAASVRSATGRKHHLIWQPDLSPPALLSNVCVVLVGPKKPISCGTVARACSCFECEDIRVVQPRCNHNTRSSRSVSKGAQYILYRTQVFEQLADALSDVDLAVAFTRWLPDQHPPALPDIPSLLSHQVVQQALQGPQILQQQQQHPGSTRAQEQEGCAARIALVFGREEFGLSDAEVAACDIACAISIGRLQESLSLSHAVSIVMAQLYQARLSALAAASNVATTELPFVVRSAAQLAEGYDSSSGIEH